MADEPKVPPVTPIVIRVLGDVDVKVETTDAVVVRRD